MKIFIAGDIIGNPGRTILQKYLDKNTDNYDFIIVNGENSAGGFGITKKVAESFFDMNVDLITGGNHIWDKKEIYPFLDEEKRIIRPLNYPIGAPGRGSVVLNTKSGKKIGIINLIGRIFMNEVDSPFQIIKEEIEKIKKETNIIIIDFHAEASSEKMAMGWFLDGMVTLVYGTHTHVLTADERIFPKGTGYITDIGMTGGFDGIIGMKREAIIDKFLNCLPAKFDVCDQNIRMNGIEIEVDIGTGRCIKIERIDIGINEI